jgi:glycosyltransferase involved in cell wall biosynthesis
MDALTAVPIISVVIPTRNRAGLLEAALQSLAEQSMPLDHYEVVVVDDGSTDATPEVCARLGSTVRLKYFRLPEVGISAARNLGIFASAGVLTLSFDDDDVADRDLLLEHVRAHQRHPEEHVAVLGYTTWARHLRVTEVMHFLTEVGQMLFSYPSMRDGEMLGFTRFWGGRTSCKRAFLTRFGVFDPRMRGMEDLELGYRLSRYGLKVLFHRSAMSYMNRPMNYDEFCQRCERQGRYRWHLTRLHPEPGVPEALNLEQAEARWQAIKEMLSDQVGRVHELEGLLDTGEDEGEREAIRGELHELYRKTFRAFYLKGSVEALEQNSSISLRGDAQGVPG